MATFPERECPPMKIFVGFTNGSVTSQSSTRLCAPTPPSECRPIVVAEQFRIPQRFVSFAVARTVYGKAETVLHRLLGPWQIPVAVADRNIGEGVLFVSEDRA